jgi:hypothetical protein
MKPDFTAAFRRQILLGEWQFLAQYRRWKMEADIRFNHQNCESCRSVFILDFSAWLAGMQRDLLPLVSERCREAVNLKQNMHALAAVRQFCGIAW